MNLGAHESLKYELCTRFRAEFLSMKIDQLQPRQIHSKTQPTQRNHLERLVPHRQNIHAEYMLRVGQANTLRRYYSQVNW
jgi:hypothetical protein